MKVWVLGLVALAGCAAPDMRSDWERKHEAALPPVEDNIVFPPYPRSRDLIEFQVAATSAFRFYVDPGAISVDKSGVVRYVLVARSDAGAENVTFEGMRCNTGEVRIYAVGRDGAWGGRRSEWRPIEPRSVQRWHNALYREYFCPQREPIASREEAVDALRRGGHPLGRDFSSDTPRAR